MAGPLAGPPQSPDTGLEQRKIVVTEQDLQLSYAALLLREKRGKGGPIQMSEHLLRVYLNESAGVLFAASDFRSAIQETCEMEESFAQSSRLTVTISKSRRRIEGIFPGEAFLKVGKSGSYEFGVNPEMKDLFFLEDPTQVIIHAVSAKVPPDTDLRLLNWDLVDLPDNFTILGEVVPVPSKKELKSFLETPKPKEETEKYGLEVYEKVFPTLFPSGLTNQAIKNLSKADIEEGTPEYALQKIGFTLVIEWAKKEEELRRQVLCLGLVSPGLYSK